MWGHMPKRGQKKTDVRAEKKKRISQPKKDAVIKKEADPDEVEKEKKLFMWVGVSCIMIAFFVVWIFNLKYQFKINSETSGKSSFSWEQTKAELDKVLGQVKQGLNEIKQLQKNSTPAVEPALKPEQINLLKGKLLNETATGTTASSTVKN